LFLLIAAGLVHDIGMVVAETEVERLSNDAAFLKERAGILAAMATPGDPDNKLRGIERLIVAEYVRRRHGRRCVLTLNDAAGPCRQLTGDQQDLKKWIGRISLGHTLTFEEVLDQSLFPQSVVVGTQNANIRFLAVCLRIGDLLDINTARAFPALRAISEPLQALSAAHWDQYRDIEVQGLKPNHTITIAGTCPSQDAERVLREWVSWLKDECENAVLALNTGEPSYSLAIGRIEYAVKPAQDVSGRPIYEFHNFRFNLDEERVFNRLFGGRLYGRPDAAIRELLQNALDATRIRVAIEEREKLGWQDLDVASRRQRTYEAVRSRAADLPVTVAFESRANPRTHKTESWLHIEDHGVGMSRDVIQSFLLKVGRSRWKEDDTLATLAVTTVGEFGIGFLSTFMISDRTVIETRSLYPLEPGIRATVYNWRGYLATEPLGERPFGTRVSLLLKPEFEADFAKLANMLNYWCPFFELPIEVREADGSSSILAVVKPAGRDNRLNALCFSVGDTGTLAAIQEQQRLQVRAVAPPLSQDGLVIPDVPPPILEVPAQQTLRRRGIRVDLRGGDRVSLDLSRNLTEGGADALWSRLTPSLWNGLCSSALTNPGSIYLTTDPFCI
jgi:hypothetical protein